MNTYRPEHHALRDHVHNCCVAIFAERLDERDDLVAHLIAEHQPAQAKRCRRPLSARGLVWAGCTTFVCAAWGLAVVAVGIAEGWWSV